MSVGLNMKFSTAVVLFIVISAMLAAAQQYEIVRADYGYGNQRMDVTQRLREVVRTHSSFRMGNSTFGFDPSPGNKKSLRIWARGPHGETQTFEYLESSTIDSSMFALSSAPASNGGFSASGWNGGFQNNGGDSGIYTILHAEYGTDWNHADVTDRLRELARADLTFRMGNSTFGFDPSPGYIKVLRIYARDPNGRERMFEYREGSTVDGSQFRAWGRGDWGREGWSGRWEGEGFRDRDHDGDHDRDRDDYDSGEY